MERPIGVAAVGQPQAVHRHFVLIHVGIIATVQIS